MATAAALPFLLGLLLLAPEQATAAHTPAPLPPTPTSPITLTIDWSKETRRTNTAATVEVDVMPFLARQPATDPVIAGHYGGPFDKYPPPPPTTACQCTPGRRGPALTALSGDLVTGITRRCRT